MTFAHDVADVLAADSGEQALRARLAELGGKDAELRDHTETSDGVRYTLLQGVAAEKLPQAVRTLHKGDLTVQREHTWKSTDDGYAGTITAGVSGVPGEITARTTLSPQRNDAAASVLDIRGEVTVRIPFVGGKLEGFIAEQVTNLLRAEAEFTKSWLARES